MGYRDEHGETNVGLGMVPHKKSCRCNECEIENLYRKLKQKEEGIRALQEDLMNESMDNFAIHARLNDILSN